MPDAPSSPEPREAPASADERASDSSSHGPSSGSGNPPPKASSGTTSSSNQRVSKSGGDAKASALQDKIYTLHTILAVASENGLFPAGGNGDRHFAALKSSLADASGYASADPPVQEKALSAMQDFYRELNEAQTDAGLAWRLANLYALPAWVYFVLAPLLVYLFLNQFHPLPDSYLLEASIWGMLGSCLQGFYWIWQQVSREQFRAQWSFWILSLPPGGLIFGGVAYLLITGGVLSLLTTAPPAVNQYSAFLFSALAGFSWKDFAGLIRRFWDQLVNAPT